MPNLNGMRPANGPEMSDDKLSPHERYMRGMPINEDLRTLRDGVRPKLKEEGESRTAPPAIADPDRELTTAERAMLRELRLHEGWPVLQRLYEKIYRQHEKDAITMSGNDPLRNSLEITNKWAYVSIFQQARREFEYVMQQVTRERADG